MKTFKVKNYKGNLVESLSKFQKSHKGMKIVEACEDGEDLKIKAEAVKKTYILCHGVQKADHGSGIEILKADIPSKKELKKEMIKFYVDGGEMDEDEIKEAFADDSFAITEIDNETGWDEWKEGPEFKTKFKKYVDLVDNGKAKFYVVDNDSGYYAEDPISFWEINI